MQIEGTVKRNEPDMYVTIEDSLALLIRGEQAGKWQRGSRLMADTIRAYRAKHPA